MKPPLDAIELMNDYGKNKTPFLFIIDFLCQNIIIKKPEELKDGSILFLINQKKNYSTTHKNNKQVELKSFPIGFNEYKKQFNLVYEAIMRGDSYLTNLTCRTEIESNLSLKEIFYQSEAKYKLFYKDEFVVFSPETFIKVIDNKIYTHPMKGTIDASIPNAKSIILENSKEKAEHYTIVDLLRNDLSLVANNVEVSKFRYIDELLTSNGKLLQVSSEIIGDLNENYKNNLGDLFKALLPAGSICGAPKKKTIEIIKNTETHNRNFYTGVFGFFDGQNLDSSVMIRYIEKTNNQLYYKSGGGVTNLSNVEDEYKEILNKIYVPIY